MTRIKVTNPFVELEGDKMVRINRKPIKENLIFPCIEKDNNCYNKDIENLLASISLITADTFTAIRQYWPGIKSSTLTPNSCSASINILTSIIKAITLHRKNLSQANLSYTLHGQV